MSDWPRGTWPDGTWPDGAAPLLPPYPTPALAGQRMSASTFPFAANFPSLYTEGGDAPRVDMACYIIESEWVGIFTLWAKMDATIRDAKRFMCEAYLVGWWLADMNPEAAEGVMTQGGVPASFKSIGGVSASFKNLEAQPALKQLESNAFGVKALGMIMSSPERMGILGGF